MDIDLTIQNVTSQIAREHARAVESELVKRIEEIEGRVPSDAEVARFGSAVILPENPSRVHYFWRGKPLFYVDPARFVRE